MPSGWQRRQPWDRKGVGERVGRRVGWGPGFHPPRQLPFLLGGYRAAAGPPGSGRNLRLAEVEGLGASLEPELSLGEQVQLRLHMEL